MAAFDLEEQEQLEELKAWWKRWGNYVTYGIAALLIGVAGYQYWGHQKATQAAEASSLFDTMQQSIEAGNKKIFKEQAAVLIDKYGSTPYATRAAMLLASNNMEEKDAKSAKAQLEWVVEHTKEVSVKDLARLRLAGILLDEKQYEEAFKQLNSKHSDAFAARFDDLKGDTYLAQGKSDEARAAYSAAYAKLKETNPMRGVVEMKLDSLGGSAK